MAEAEGTRGASAADDGEWVVHVDCERCGSRLEVRLPLEVQLAGGDVTVRCGACTALLQVAVPAPVPPALVASRGKEMSLPLGERRGLSQNGAGGGSDSLSSFQHEEQQRHLELARYHMDMAQQHSSSLGRMSAGPKLMTSIGGLQHMSSTPHTPSRSLAQIQNHQDDDPLSQRSQHAWGMAPYSGAAQPHDLSSMGPAAAVSDVAGRGQISRMAKVAKRERKPRDPSPYNVFIREEISRLKEKHPELNHKEAFKAAAKNWANSPLNMRSAAYVPMPLLHATGGGNIQESAANGDEGGSGDVNRLARAAIMRKLQPHLLKCREDDKLQSLAAEVEMPAVPAEAAVEAAVADGGSDGDSVIVAEAATTKENHALTVIPVLESPGESAPELDGRGAVVQPADDGASEKGKRKLETFRGSSPDEGVKTGIEGEVTEGATANRLEKRQRTEDEPDHLRSLAHEGENKASGPESVDTGLDTVSRMSTEMHSEY